MMQNNDPFDPAKFRLGQDFDKRAGTRKPVTVVPVRKPNRFEYIRVHPSDRMCLHPAGIIEVPGGQPYLVSPQVFDAQSRDVRLVMLFTAITRQGALFLWPAKLSKDGRTNTWNESAMGAAVRGQTEWLRVCSNDEAAIYDTEVPVIEIPDPDWPDVTFAQLLEIAFRGRVIEDCDHPILRRLRGEL